MPVESSVERDAALRPAFDLAVVSRLAMVALGYIPFLHACATIAAVTLAARRGGIMPALATGLIGVYLVPPLAARIARPKLTLTSERYLVGTHGFLRWWYITQWQVLFNRFLFWEECLRMVPGLYSTWLRLWGARVGSLVYWSPRITVLDRPFLEIGDRVVIGADTKLSPHFLASSAEGQMELVLSPISIGHDAMIGGSTLLPAGVRIDPCEQTPGFRPMAPFARFRGGRHLRTKRFTKEEVNA